MQQKQPIGQHYIPRPPGEAPYTSYSWIWGTGPPGTGNVYKEKGMEGQLEPAMLETGHENTFSAFHSDGIMT